MEGESYTMRLWIMEYGRRILHNAVMDNGIWKENPTQCGYG